MNYYRMAFNKYAVFSGRARRKEYWIFTICNAVLINVVDLVSPIISSIIALVILTPWFAVGVRRMHDVNKSGWFILIPLYNLFLAWTDGTKGTNKYGPDPKTAPILSQSHENNVEVSMSTREIRDGSGLTTAWAHGQTTVTKSKEKNAVKEHGDIKYCEHCGKDHIKSARFCVSCGKPFPSGV